MNEQPIRILHLRASNFLGGPERQILRYAEMEKDGPLEVIVGSFLGAHEGEELLSAAEERGIESVAFPADGKLAAVNALSSFISDENISLLCSHGYQADLLGMLACRRRGVPLASFLRGWTREDWKVRLYEAMDRRCVRYATRVVCLSEIQARKLARRGLGKERIRVVTNTITLADSPASLRREARAAIEQRFGISPIVPLVIWAGRLSPEKGAGYFLKSLPELRQVFPEMRAILFGDGPLASELRQESLRRRTGAIFAGHVSDFPQLLPGADVLVNSSLSEEMPNVVLEAMSAGVPVVATAVGGVPEIAGESRGLALVPPGDVRAIADAVLRVLSDPQLAGRMSSAARFRVRDAYSPERQRAQLHALYRELIPQMPQVETAFTANEAAGATENLPCISVVMPVRNEEKHLGAVLDALLAQDYPRDYFEILVADGESDDGTAALVEERAERSPVPLRLLPNPRRRSSAGRNIGVRASAGEVVMFLDGHCHVPSRNLLRDTAALLETTQADCLCRPQPLDAPGNSWSQRLVAEVRATWIGHGRDSRIYDMESEAFINPASSGAIYRARVFEKIGMYDERFDACEDVEFNHRVWRAGMLAYSSPKLAVHYQPRGTVWRLFRQMLRYGRGRFRLIRKHTAAASASQFVPAGFLVFMTAGLIAGIRSPGVFWVTLAVAAAYALALLTVSVGLAAKLGARALAAGPLVIATIHLGLGAGFILEAALSLWRWVWPLPARLDWTSDDASGRPVASEQETVSGKKPVAR